MFEVHEPLTFVLDFLSDQICQLAIRVGNPTTGIPTVLNQCEAFTRKKEGEVPKDTVLLFEQNLELHLRAEGDLVAGNKTQVAHPDHLWVG